MPIFQKKVKKKSTTLTFTIYNQTCIFIHSILYKRLFIILFFYWIKLLAFQGNFCCQPSALGQIGDSDILMLQGSEVRSLQDALEVSLGDEVT